MNAPPFDPHSQNYFSRSHSSKKLPSPVELASRLEEARISAKLLEQVVINTPPQEILNNELIKEFADRCLSASRSIQAYMVSDNPAPDNDTMENLIDTNEQLQAALHQHQRGVLNARKQLGINERSANATPSPVSEQQLNGLEKPMQWQNTQAGSSISTPPTLPPRQMVGNGKGKEAAVYNPGPSGLGKDLPTEPAEDPFRDPQPEGGSSSKAGSSSALDTLSSEPPPRLGFEPFHPGFSTTSSYVGRQESAVGKVAMSGAGSHPAEEPRTATLDVGSGPHDYDEDEDDDDLYEGTPKKKEPMYRY
jgi:GAT domain